MAYQNKTISNFDVIRKLVRNLYLEGFNNYLETESLGKSSRAFTNNLNSIRNFLDERFMSKKTSTKKKSNPAISFNTRDETENPLFALWKTQNSLASNLSFDFAIMDILEDNPKGISWFSLTSDSDSNRHDNILCNYVSKGIDKKSVKAKLKKLENAGLIKFFDNGKKICKIDTKEIKKLLSSKEVKQAIQFASETCPLGVIGSYILDNLKSLDSASVSVPIYYKHHFIFNSIDYEIMYTMLEAITSHLCSEIESEHFGLHTIVPLKIYISTRTGRSYVIFWDLNKKNFFSENLEYILSAKNTKFYSDYDELKTKLAEKEPYLWGVSFKHEETESLEQVRFVIEYQTPKEKSYIPSRIKRETVTGILNEIDEFHLQFSADLIDSNEIIPWIRSFYGRITEIEFPYTSKIINDITLLSEGRFRKSDIPNNEKTKLPPYEIKNESENTPLFSPLYSAYYLIVKNILEFYLKNNKKPLKSDVISRIVNNTIYIESPGDLYDIINNHSDITTIFQESQNGITSPIKYIPDFPLSTIELRFLATILNDVHVTMFFDTSTLNKLKEILKEVPPLWYPENIRYFDQNKDGDNFNNKEYMELFQTLLKSINENSTVQLVYGRKEDTDIFTPTHMDYSQKDDTFRLFVKELQYPINLVNIKSCVISNEKPTRPEEMSVHETLRVMIYDDTEKKYHFNRAIRQFSYFKKTCRKTDDDNIYEMSIDYDKIDESEIVIKVLMFGPNMKVLEPKDVIDKINTKILKQTQLFDKLKQEYL